jgi:hypothetical protein
MGRTNSPWHSNRHRREILRAIWPITYSNSDTNGDSYIYFHPNCIADIYGHAYGYLYACFYTQRNTNSYSNAYVNSNINSASYSYPKVPSKSTITPDSGSSNNTGAAASYEYARCDGAA